MQIVGVDGEGVGRKPHRYTLLAWSNVDGSQSSHLENARGLSSFDCLSFLTSLPRGARAYGFYLGYDYTKILADLPDASIYSLLRPELRVIPRSEGGGFAEVGWRKFRLHYLGGMLRVRNTRTRRTLTLWDVGKFYQCSFVEALKKWGIKAPIDRIAAMKGKRDKFTAKQRAEIREYCLSECRALAALVTELNAAHEAAGLKLRTWYGPGSTASVGLRQMKIHEKRGEHPPEVHDAANRAFFGGRFEHATIGELEGPVYGYDLVSAYPAACARLPCLEHATWHRTSRERDLENAKQALVRYALPETDRPLFWGALPCRLPNGTIVFPRSGASGWTFLDEFSEAREHWPNVGFCEAWILRTRCKCAPFARVWEWFEERLHIGKSGRGIVLKLFLNSLYGKLAQLLGKPLFASRLWAGMITSMTRAALLSAIAQAPGSILCTATDGIYSMRELDLDIGEKLGQWERKEVKKITLVRPGIYWTDESVRARGIGRMALPEEQREAILEALARGEERVDLPPVTRFGGARAGVYRAPKGVKRSERFGEWYEQPCRLSFDPAPKRAPGFGLWDLPGVESAPYDPRIISPDRAKLERAEDLRWGAH